MKGFAIRRKLAMLVAAVVTVVGVGTMQGSSAGSSKIRSYVVYDFATGVEVANGGYILSLPEQYSSVSTYDVIEPDTRVDYKNSGVVRLSFNEGAATGFIVGDHTIATAAHCVYNNTTSEYYTNMKIKLYDDNGVLTKTLTESNTTIQAHVPVKFKSGYKEYDYALLTVTEDLSDYEHFQLGEMLSSAANSSSIPVSVCGYSDNTLEIGTGNLVGISENYDYIKYNTDTDNGDSGGPVFVSSIYAIDTDVVELKTVIAIHVRGYSNRNEGTRITPELRQFYLYNAYNTYEE